MSLEAVLNAKRNWHVERCDVLDGLRMLPDGCVNAVVTSPPYYALRSYLPADHADKAKEHGSEPNPEAFIATMVAVFEEVRRVLRDDGVCWVNLGDSYASTWNCRRTNKVGNGSPSLSERCDTTGGTLKEGDKLNMPHRVAEALQAAGWWWRDTVIWHKLSPMPESVAGWRWTRCKVKTKVGAVARMGERVGSGFDYRETELAEWSECPGCPKCLPNDGWVLRRGKWRCTQSHEYIFQFAKSAEYFCDGIAAAAGMRDNVKDENKNLQTMRSRGSLVGIQQESQSSRRDAGRMQVLHEREDCELAGDSQWTGVNDAHEEKVSGEAGSTGEASAIQSDGANEDSAKAMEGVASRSQLRGGVSEIKEKESGPSQIQHEREGSGCAEAKLGERARSGAAGEVRSQETVSPGGVHQHLDGRRVDCHSKETETPLFLLQAENDSFDDGPCDSAQQGRASRKGKRRGRVPQLQCDQGEQDSNPVLANPRNVWSLPHEPTSEKHFAAYPTEIVRKCLLPSLAHAYCAACGAPHAPMVVEERKATRPALTNKIWKHDDGDCVGQRSDDSPNLDPERHIKCSTVVGYRATCGCNAGTTTGLVLDPYCGTGTTGEVALKLGARFIGFELNDEYKRMADRRVKKKLPLFA